MTGSIPNISNSSHIPKTTFHAAISAERASVLQCLRSTKLNDGWLGCKEMQGILRSDIKSICAGFRVRPRF